MFYERNLNIFEIVNLEYGSSYTKLVRLIGSII